MEEREAGRDARPVGMDVGCEGGSPGVDEVFVRLAQELLKATWGMGKRGPASQATEATRGEAAMLGFLSHVGDPVTPGELASEFRISSARVATLLNGLEARGLVDRRHDTRDRRKVFVSVTAAGRAEHLARHDEFVGKTAATLSAIGEHDARELVRIARKARVALGCPPVADSMAGGLGQSSEGKRA